MSLKPTYEELEKRILELEQEVADLRRSETPFGDRKFVDYLFTNAPYGFYLIDLTGKVVVANVNGAERLGQTVESIIGKTLRDFYPPDVAERRRQAGMEALKRDKPVDFIDELDGSWYRGLVCPIKDKNGNPTHFAIYGADITDYKKTELALKESEEKYRTVVQNTHEAIVVLQKERAVFVNDRFVELFGYTLDDLRDRTMSDLMHPEDSESALRRYNDVLKGGGDNFGYDYRIIDRSNRVLWTRCHAIRIDWNNAPAVLTFIHNITEKKLADEALKESEKKLRDLTDQTEQLSLAAASMLSIRDTQTVFDSIARAIVDHSDFRRVIISLFKDEPPYRDIIGYGGVDRTIIDRLRTIEMPKSWYDDVFDQGTTVGRLSYYVPHTMKHILNQEATIFGEGKAPETDSAWHPEDNLFVRMNDENGEFIGVISVDDSKSGLRPSDDTVRPLEIFSSLISQIIILKREQEERKKLEQQLFQAGKMESIGTLTGGIAHDFNNILGIILGNSELALHEIPEWNPAHFNLQEIKTASLRATDIVRQLLSFSRKTDRKLVPVDIVPIIQDSIKFLRSTIPTTVEIRHRFNAAESTLLADPTQINQIMLNLCTNAYHAMEQSGGILNIEVENVILDEWSAERYPELDSGEYVKVTIGDTGHGMSPEIIGRIFEPYFTTKETGKGSGMGLAVVLGIIKGHNGAISVESEQEKGATFRMLFPKIDAAPRTEQEDTAKMPRGKERILFVDDEESLLTIGRRMLGRLGYQVELAMNPVHALERFRSNPDRYDLVLTDMTMPHMTGAALSAEIKRIRKGTPVIICTGYSALIDEEKAKNMGVEAYVMKPFVMRDIANTIRDVLDAR